MANRFLVSPEDIKKFSKAKKLIKYAELEPVIKPSGMWINCQVISKQDNYLFARPLVSDGKKVS